MWLPVDPRACVASLAMLLVIVATVLVTFGTGALPVAPREFVSVVLGQGPPGTTFVVMQLGMPRACLAIVAGAALGAAGALVQALTRNPLGSPDVIGFDSGTAAGVLIGVVAFGLSPSTSVPLAVIGGMAAATAVYLLAAGGRDTGYRILLIGIGIGAMLDSFTAYLLVRGRTEESLSAARWLIGTLNSTTWNDVRLGLLGMLVVLPIAILLSRHLRTVLLGPQVATALGVPVALVTAATLLISVALSTIAVVTAGPISFVALAAPQLALRACGGGREPRVVASAVMGAMLLTVSDFLAQRAFGDTDLPVGVITGAVGGAYLVWLLAHEWKRRTR